MPSAKARPRPETWTERRSTIRHRVSKPFDWPDRQKQKHYQAWQVINTAQGKGGSGGRIEALHELNEDRVPLVGVNVSSSFLQGLKLKDASLVRADFSAT